MGRRSEIERPRGLGVLEDLADPIVKLQIVIEEALSIDQFSLHFRLHVMLQLVTKLKVLILESHHLVHLLHQVPTLVILFVRGRLNTCSHTHKGVVLSIVIHGIW